MSSTGVGFIGLVSKVQTTADGGWRLTLDAGVDSLGAAAVLMAIRDSAVTVMITEGEDLPAHDEEDWPPDVAYRMDTDPA